MKTTGNYTITADDLLTRRKALDLSQSALSRETNPAVSAAAIHKIEHGEHAPRSSTAHAILRALDRLERRAAKAVT